MSDVQQIQSIILLRPGETPWRYTERPKALPGDWGAVAKQAVTLFREKTGRNVSRYWIRPTGGAGLELWIEEKEEVGGPRPAA